jgi:hypothetical protein
LLKISLTANWKRWLIGVHLGTRNAYLHLGPYVLSLWMEPENLWSKPRPLIRRGP